MRNRVPTKLTHSPRIAADVPLELKRSGYQSQCTAEWVDTGYGLFATDCINKDNEVLHFPVRKAPKGDWTINGTDYKIAVPDMHNYLFYYVNSSWDNEARSNLGVRVHRNVATYYAKCAIRPGQELLLMYEV